jgi:hypothetical protein
MKLYSCRCGVVLDLDTIEYIFERDKDDNKLPGYALCPVCEYVYEKEKNI